MPSANRYSNPLASLSTRINNSLKASGSSEQINRSAQTIIRKLQGKRASTKLTDDEKKALEAEGKTANQISAAQMSYDNRIENFSMLISFLSSVPQYNPNEEELKIESLKNLHATFKAKNMEAITASIHLTNARIARNKVLYNPTTGLVEVCTNAKTYIKSLYGTSSPYYKQISKLEFKRVNKQSQTAYCLLHFRSSRLHLSNSQLLLINSFLQKGNSQLLLTNKLLQFVNS